MRMRKFISILCSLSILISALAGITAVNAYADAEKSLRIVYDEENSSPTEKNIKVYYEGYEGTYGGTVSILLPDSVLDRFESTSVTTPLGAMITSSSNDAVKRLHMVKYAMAMGALGTSDDGLFMDIIIKLSSPLTEDWMIELEEEKTTFMDQDKKESTLSEGVFGYETVTIEADESTGITETEEPQGTLSPDNTAESAEEPTVSPAATRKPSSGSSGGSGSSSGGSSSGSASTRATSAPTTAPTAAPSAEPEETDAPVGEISKPTELKEVRFTDLDGAAWAKDAITYLADRGIVNGRTETSFEPNGEITRAEFAKLVASAYGFYIGDDQESKFTDVNESDWFAPYVLAAADNGIVTGYPDNTFGPNNRVLRQEMAVMLYRAQKAFDLELSEINEEKAWTDEVPDWASEAVTALQMAGIINGMTETTFGGSEPSTRAQAAQMIYNLYRASE